MKSAPTVHDTGAAILNVETASGRTKPVTSSGRASVFSALSTSAGSVAMDELELNAMSCGSRAARAKRRIGIWPKMATTGESSSVATMQGNGEATREKPIGAAE